MEIENMEIHFVHHDCTYIKYLDLSTICTSFDIHLDHTTLQSNIASVLASDGVVLKENDKIKIEIPEWDTSYDVTYKASKQVFHNTSTTSAPSSTVTSNSTQPAESIKTWTSRTIHLLIENRSDLEQEFNGNKKNFKIWEKYQKDYKDSVAPKKNTLCESSLTNLKKTNNDDQSKEAPKISVLNDEDHSDDELTSIMPKKKKKKNFQDVLLEEFKEDRKSRDVLQKKLENYMEELISIEKSKLEKL
ncbi:BED-type domain-containing protein [Aphis craccivora]|uniref:BED-type domain-containing protein n=1 Tax=Aphis craccivora TaxID=307492 RepID=A0A6G0W235_APHCR|nr:BED-type domain-containing protein [Aphis craccivora]